MSYIQSLDNIPVWGLFIIATGLFSFGAELGFRAGKFTHERQEKDQNPMVGTILGASLGLLAFFLAFTFNMAGSRYDARKKLIPGVCQYYIYSDRLLAPKYYWNQFQTLI